jgi:hypothetical protein
MNSNELPPLNNSFIINNNSGISNADQSNNNQAQKPRGILGRFYALFSFSSQGDRQKINSSKKSWCTIISEWFFRAHPEKDASINNNSNENNKQDDNDNSDDENEFFDARSDSSKEEDNIEELVINDIENKKIEGKCFDAANLKGFEFISDEEGGDECFFDSPSEHVEIIKKDSNIDKPTNSQSEVNNNNQTDSNIKPNEVINNSSESATTFTQELEKKMPVFNRLTIDQKNQFIDDDKNQGISYSITIENTKYSTHVFYQLVDVNHAKAYDVYWNPESAKDFIPTCCKVEILKQECMINNKNTLTARYSGGVGIKGSFELKNTGTIGGTGDKYETQKISWELAKASDYFEKNSGNIQFTPVGKNGDKTLIRYETTLCPHKASVFTGTKGVVGALLTPNLTKNIASGMFERIVVCIYKKAAEEKLTTI